MNLNHSYDSNSFKISPFISGLHSSNINCKKYTLKKVSTFESQTSKAHSTQNFCIYFSKSGANDRQTGDNKKKGEEFKVMSLGLVIPKRLQANGTGR